MADQFLSLLDLTNRTGNDAAVGLVEEVTTYAPEVDVVMGRPITGTSYKARVRSTVTSKAAFRNVNEGLAIGASRYEMKRFDCFYFDTQLQVDEALMAAATGEGDSPASVLADEASGALKEKMIVFGAQFYKGTANDAKGFPGLIDFLNPNLVVDATGTGASTERVWFIFMDIKGIHMLFGLNKGLQLGAWIRQQVKDANSNSLFAQVNNLAGYIGLSCAFSWSVGCVKNVTAAKPMTDALAAQLYAKFKIGTPPNLCFMSRTAKLGLQTSRSFTSVTNASAAQRTAGGGEVWAPAPETVAGVKIVTTDSIALEAAS